MFDSQLVFGVLLGGTCRGEVDEAEIVGSGYGIQYLVFFEPQAGLYLYYCGISRNHLKPRRSVHFALESKVQRVCPGGNLFLLLVFLHNLRECGCHQSGRYGKDGNTQDTDDTGDDTSADRDRRRVGKVARVTDVLRKSP